jgi:subtilase family serine protease
MIKMRSLPLYALASACLFSASVLAQQNLAQLAAPTVRIVSPIDESQLVTLTHTVHPLANAANDRGAAPDGMLLDRLQLVLQRSPDQEAALRQLIAGMNAPGSPSYHQWLTPDQFGAQFGASDQDIATVSTWLGNHGFSVTKVNPGKGTLEFSGSVGQLRDTFHTQIHKYEVNAETHYANANDPQIPSALTPVIAGFSSLNNFHPKPQLKKLGEASFNPLTHQVTPQWTQASGNGVFFVLAPGDFAKQYDLTPLYSAGTNGSGQTIAIINDSNINIDLVNQFRTLFGLSANPPQVIIDGNDPGVDGINNLDGPNYDSVEAYLDVEWSGAVAPNATIDLVIAGDTALENGLILAIERAIYSNVAPVLSLSFGNCEASLGAYNVFLNNLWEQAAAQGQTAMVSTGDAGSAGCDNDNTEEFAVNGHAVNGFGSTPYNVAVGGTDFYYSSYNAGSTALNTQLATYWSTTATQLPAVSLQSVIPEQPWNDSQYGLNAVNYYTQDTGSTATTIGGGGGGASNAAVCSTNTYSSGTTCTGTLSGYPKPAWQTGTGAQTDTVRDVPDVSLFAANGSNYSFYPICATDGDCQSPSGSNQVQIFGVGGTSASSPAFAGIMALVNQKYGRQGQADTILYPLKAQFPAAFHDITNGTNSVPCEILPGASTNCIAVTSPITVTITGSNGVAATYTEGQIGTGTTPEYNAAAGYNLATGLGTIDANVLVTDWNKVTLATSAVTMTPGSTNITHGTAVNISGAVTGTTPTGNVTLMTDGTEPNQQGQGLATVTNGFSGTFGNGVFPLNGSSQYSGSVTTLPGGSYNIWGSYGGDSKNAGSVSSKTAVNVTPEASGVFLQAISPAGTATGGTSISGTVDYGTQLNLSAQIAPSSQLSAFETCTTTCPVFTLPTGQVTFIDGSSNINTAVINAEGDAEFNAPFAVGAHSVTASFSGDQSYNKSTSSAITFTVGKDLPTLQLSASAISGSSQGINGPGQPLVFTVQILNTAQASAMNSSTGAVYPVPVAAPTGTVTQSGLPSGVPTSATLSAAVDPANQGGTQAVEGVANFIIPSGTASGTYTVNFSYSGDGNYAGIAAGQSQYTYSIPVVNTNGDGEQNSTTTATMSGSISPNTLIAIAGTVAGTSGHPAPTGAIYVYSEGYYINTINISAGAGTTSSFATTLSSQVLPQGANQVTLQYSGDSVYNPSAFTLNGGSNIANPLADFTLVPNTTIVPVSISGGASSGTDTINVASVNGFTGTVNLTCAATTPLTCGITPNPALSNSSSATSTLTINVPTGAANGSYNIAVTGKDAATGEFIHTLGITAAVTGSGPGITLTNSGNITVVQGATIGNTSTITVTPVNAFTGTVNLTCAVTSAPTPASNPLTCSTANLTPSSVNTTGTTALTSVLTVNSTATTTSGAYQITVTGTSGSVTSSTVVNVTVNLPADFAISNSGPISFPANASTGNTATITVTPSGGFSSPVALTCTSVTPPSGASNPFTCSNVSLNPTSITPPGPPTTSTLTVTTTSSTTTGAYNITVTGTAGADVHPTTVNVTVTAAVPSSFTLSKSGDISLAPGATTGNTSTITVTPSGGFTGTVSLSCAITPTAANDPATCSFSSQSVVISGAAQTSTLTIGTAAAVADLIYPKVGKGNGWLGAGSGALLALLVFFGIPARRRSWRAMLGILIAMAALGVMSSCGGGSSGGGGGTTPSNPGTTAGTYTVTVTGTSGSITQTQPVTLSVQ